MIARICLALVLGSAVVLPAPAVALAAGPSKLKMEDPIVVVVGPPDERRWDSTSSIIWSAGMMAALP
jgi:hypothetical protein